MTAALIDLTHPGFQEMLDRQTQFDATRPPCPAGWCDQTCDGVSHLGDATMHFSHADTVPVAIDLAREPDRELLVRCWRYDSLDGPSEAGVEVLDNPDLPCLQVDGLNFTAAQARQLGALLLTAADRAEPEYEVPAEQVRVGDRITVAGGWLYVYCVDWDEPSSTVQLFTTVDPTAYPEIGTSDEEPLSVRPGDLVRIRRGGAR